MDLTGNVIMPLIAGGATSNSKLSDGLPLVFDGSQIVFPACNHHRLKLSGNGFRVVFCEHARFASESPGALQTAASVPGQAPLAVQTRNTRTCQGSCSEG